MVKKITKIMKVAMLDIRMKYSSVLNCDNTGD